MHGGSHQHSNGGEWVWGRVCTYVVFALTLLLSGQMTINRPRSSSLMTMKHHRTEYDLLALISTQQHPHKIKLIVT
jgi:hypothetical protein